MDECEKELAHPARLPLGVERAVEATVALMAPSAAPPPPVIDLSAGDCRVMLRDFPPASVHLVLTDPPYHLDGLDERWRKGARPSPARRGVVGGLPAGMAFDPAQGRALQAFAAEIGGLLLPALVPGAFCVMFSQPRLAHRMASGLEDAGFEIRDQCAWLFRSGAQFKAFGMDHFIARRRDWSEAEKERARQRCAGRKTPQLRPEYEVIILAQKPRDGSFLDNWLRWGTGLIDVKADPTGKSPGTALDFPKPRREPGNDHLTVKPVPLFERLARLLSAPGQTVLDPFVGSGTTALACRRAGRNCVGWDINPDYIAIAESRLAAERAAPGLFDAPAGRAAA